MGRSVETPRHAAAVTYCEVTGDEDFLEDFIDQLQSGLSERWPSLTPVDRPLAYPYRETRAIAANRLAVVTISEYRGLVALSLVPREYAPGMRTDDTLFDLSLRWCDQVAGRFVRVFGRLDKVGTFSNGEAIFRRRS